MNHLSKRYGDVLAVNDFSLVIQRGEVVGLLGRNGAGKSTTVRLVVGLELPTAGEVYAFGLPPATAAKRNLIGYCSQDLAFYPTRSLLYNLVYFGQIAGQPHSDAVRAAREIAELLGLSAHLDRRANDLSGGYKRRLHLAIALVGNAPILVLDEPTAGVDVESRELIIETVRRLADSGRSVLYTSHDLVEMERLCDRVTILSRGVERATGTLKELSGSVGQLVRLEFDDRGERDHARRLLANARVWGATGLDVQLDRTDLASECVEKIQGSGWKLRRVEILPPGLESIFLQITRGEDEAERSS